MRNYPFDVRQALIDRAKDEFMECGFEKASLRTICKSAGVTTGAFYSYFGRKDDLFSAIVEPVLQQFCEICKSILQQQRQHETNGGELRSVKFMLEHRDEFILLLDCSKGTDYENFQDEVLNGFMLESYQIKIDSNVGKPVDHNLVNIILRMKFEEYRQLLYADYPMEEAVRLVNHLTKFTESGFDGLIEELKAADE